MPSPSEPRAPLPEASSLPSPAGAAPPRLEFRGGLPGALLPFALFLAGVGWLGLSGAPDERGFWPVLLAALALGLFLARNGSAYAEAMIAGMSQPIVMLMISAWLLAGVLATLMSQSGFVDALVWIAQQLRLTGGAYVAAAFLACCVVSTSTGTSFGTILVCGPLLYPAGGPVGADPALLIGAILGGATFGDSISPISDTTIASAGTQDADIGGTVRSRLKYVLPAAAVAVVFSLVLGAAEGTNAAAAPASAAGARGLPMLVVPASVIALLLAGRHLVQGLMVGIVVAVALALAFGLIAPSQLIHIEQEAFAARGLVIDGLERGVGVSIFTILLVALVSTVKATGVLERLVAAARARATDARGAELRIFATVSAAVLLTTHSVVAILAVGEFAKETGRQLGLTRYRRANLLDVTVCTFPFLLPYFIPAILAAGATASGAAQGLPRLSPLVAGMHNVYSWALLAMVLFAVISGYGREEGAGIEVGPLQATAVPGQDREQV
jgi:Na+/H+ antiporter NhaC